MEKAHDRRGIAAVTTVPTHSRSSAYGLAALQGECVDVARTLPGAQYRTLTRAALAIGGLVKGGMLLEAEAFADLVEAGCQMVNEAGKRPWTKGDIERRVRSAFEFTEVRPNPNLATKPPIVPPKVVLAREEVDPVRPGLSDWAGRLWRASTRISVESLAGRYLAGRGCSLPHPEGDLRSAPNVLHPSGNRYSAMIGLITDAASGEPMSLHMTFLDRDGGGKAPVEPARRYLKGHRKAGGVVRLSPDCDVETGLGVGEGIETCLTAARGFQPVWACLDDRNLATFPVLPGIEALTIVADHDTAGIQAAASCAERWTAAGCKARMWLADQSGDDLNDWAAA